MNEPQTVLIEIAPKDKYMQSMFLTADYTQLDELLADKAFLGMIVKRFGNAKSISISMRHHRSWKQWMEGQNPNILDIRIAFWSRENPDDPVTGCWNILYKSEG